MSRNNILGALWVAGVIAAIGVVLSGTPLADRDFSSFWVAGRLALDGKAVAAYDAAGLIGAAKIQLGTATEIAFAYPPHALFLFAPLAVFPYATAFALWIVVTAALFWLAARPYLPKGIPGFLLVASPAALINIQFGQTGLLYGALWLTAFRFPVAAAALTFKPHLGLLAAVQVIRASRLVLASAVAVALILLSVLAFGFGAWEAYWTDAVSRQAGMLRSSEVTVWDRKMTTPLISYGYIGWLAFAAAAALLLARDFNVFTAATAAFLISPYGFHYDMTVVCLGFGLLLYERWEALSAVQKTLAGLAFMSPPLVALGSWLIPPILLLGLWAQTNQVPEGARLWPFKEAAGP